MSDDLFKFLNKKKEKKSSLIESLLSESKEENKEEVRNEEGINKTEDDILKISESSNTSLLNDVESDNEKLDEDMIPSGDDILIEKTGSDSGEGDILQGATGMRVLSLDEDEEEEEDMLTEKMVKITASSSDDLKNMEYVIYLLSSKNFDEAIEFINNWKNGI